MTIEIVYVWPTGREEVRYRRPYPSEDATRFISEVEEMTARLAMTKEECPYSYRFVEPLVSAGATARGD